MASQIRLRKRAGITTLRERRIALTDKFASKAAARRMFGHWFPKNQGRQTRISDKYLEKTARPL